MQSLEKMLDEKKTVKEVQAHLKIFERLRTRIQIEDTILRKREDNNQGAANSRDYTIDRNIQTISKIDKKNDEIDRYQEWFFKKFNVINVFTFGCHYSIESVILYQNFGRIPLISFLAAFFTSLRFTFI